MDSYLLLIEESSSIWTPADITNCVGFYSADSSDNFTFSSGSNISQWDDLSGNSNHLTQSGNTVALNGDIVEHSSGGYTSASISNSESTITLAYGGIANTTGHRYLCCYGDSSRRFAFSGGDTNSDAITLRFGNGRGEAPSSYVINTTHIGVATYETNHTSSTLRYNGTDISSSLTFTNPSSTITVSNISSLYTNRSDYHAAVDNDLEFLVLCLPKISTADMEKIEGWWAHTFNHTDKLPIGHPYKDNPPTK